MCLFMVKNTKLILVLVATVVVIILLFLTIKYIPFGERAKFIGTWKTEDGVFVYKFFADGTGIFKGAFSENLSEEKKGNWEIKNGELLVKVGVTTVTYVYSFSKDNTVLKLDGLTLYKTI